MPAEAQSINQTTGDNPEQEKELAPGSISEDEAEAVRKADEEHRKRVEQGSEAPASEENK